MKLKRGTEHILEDGTRVWVERDRGDGSVVVCYSHSRAITDTFDTVLVSNLRPASKVSQKALNKAIRPSDKNELNKWFEEQEVPERCENCNLPLNAFNKWAKRTVTAHILSKSQFPEVSTHPANRMFLGSYLFSDCGCHATFDNSDAETRKAMRVYPIAIERVKQFIHLIPENKLNRLEKYLGL